MDENKLIATSLITMKQGQDKIILPFLTRKEGIYF